MTSKKTPPNLQLQQVRISDQIADHIVRYIEEHQQLPGPRQPIAGELTRLFGVSRPTVREATNALAGRGLIAVSSGKSPTVLPLSKVPFSNLAQHGLATQQITPIQILEVRHSLDLQAAVLAAEHRTPADIDRLNAIATHSVTMNRFSLPSISRYYARRRGDLSVSGLRRAVRRRR